MHRVRGWSMGLVVGGVLLTAGPTAAQIPRDGSADARPTAPARGAHGGDDATFWEALGDSVLDRLIAEARIRSHDLLAAEARVEEAEASRVHSALELAPIVTADVGYTRRRFAAASFPGTGSAALPDENVWESWLRASWEVDVFGRLREGVRARDALTEVAAEDVRDRRIGVTARVADTYFELRGLQDQVAVARRNAENQRRTVALTVTRLEAGRGTDFDVERARAQLSSTLAAIPSLEARAEAAEYRLAVLMGREPGELELGGSGSLPELPEAVPPVDAADVLEARPDVVAAGGRLEATRALVGSAKADYLPRLSLTAGAGYTAPAVEAFGNTGTFNYAVGPVLSWAAFDLGRVKARVDAARAQEREARVGLEHVRLRAQEELDAAYARYHASRSRLGHLREAAAASERAAGLARRRYEGGVADFLHVLDAERTLLVAQDQLARARTAAAAAYVALYRARGGVWEQ